MAVLRKLRLTRCRIVPISGVLKTDFHDFEDGTMKLILPLLTLAGAITLLINSAAVGSLAYL